MFLGDFDPPPERALLSDEDRAVQQAGGTWTDIFDEGGLNDWAPGSSGWSLSKSSSSPGSRSPYG